MDSWLLKGKRPAEAASPSQDSTTTPIVSVKKQKTELDFPSDDIADMPIKNDMDNFKPVEAIDLLDRILQHIVDDHHRGYKKLLAETGIEEVKRIQMRAVRPPVFALMKNPERPYWNSATLHSLGGDLQSQKPSVYADIVEDTQDIDFLKMYAGQAEVLRTRLQEHSRKRKSESTLHYKVSNGNSAKTQFIVLGQFAADQANLDLHLNIHEMWFACLFQTLPRKQLERYLRPDELLKKEIGLNIASPLSQTHGQSAVKARGLLKYSTDPLTQQYYQEVVVPQNQANWAKGRAVNAADEFKSIIVAKRANSKWQHLVRDPATEDEKIVIVQCVECQSEKSKKQDPAPTYEISSGKYIVRGQRCPVCPNPKGNGMKQTFFEPVDPNIAKIRERQVYRKFT